MPLVIERSLYCSISIYPVQFFYFRVYFFKKTREKLMIALLSFTRGPSDEKASICFDPFFFFLCSPWR